MILAVLLVAAVLVGTCMPAFAAQGAQSYSITLKTDGEVPGIEVSVPEKAAPGEQVTVSVIYTITPSQYRMGIDGMSIRDTETGEDLMTVDGDTFTMPATNVTVEPWIWTAPNQPTGTCAIAVEGVNDLEGVKYLTPEYAAPGDTIEVAAISTIQGQGVTVTGLDLYDYRGNFISHVNGDRFKMPNDPTLVKVYAETTSAPPVTTTYSIKVRTSDSVPGIQFAAIEKAEPGASVRIRLITTNVPKKYQVSIKGLEVYDDGDWPLFTKNGDMFTMPDSNVVVNVRLNVKEVPQQTDSQNPKYKFSDVQNPNHAYFKAIYWAAEKGITNGYPDGTFGINKSCTRGEMMMFLWKYAGKPAPKAAATSPFKDVPKNHTFYKAILWGSQKGITKGYSDGTFGVNRNVTRGEAMMFLWRLKGKPAPKAAAVSPFKDVPKNHVFYKAILWGSQNKVTTGYTSGENKGKFMVNQNCSRGQIVTFLYRAR